MSFRGYHYYPRSVIDYGPSEDFQDVNISSRNIVIADGNTSKSDRGVIFYTSNAPDYSGLFYSINDSKFYACGTDSLGNVNINRLKRLSGADPVDNEDFATKTYVDNSSTGGGLPLSGGTMTGNIDMNNHSLNNIYSLSGNSTSIRVENNLSLNSNNLHCSKAFLNGGGDSSDIFEISSSLSNFIFKVNDSLNGVHAVEELTNTTDNNSTYHTICNITSYWDGTLNGGQRIMKFLDYTQYPALKQMCLGSSTYDTSTTTMLSVHGDINVNSSKIINVTDPTNNQDAATKSYVDSVAAGGGLPVTGGTMSGNIDMGSNAIINTIDPTNAQDVATKNYVDSVASGGGLPTTGGTMTGDIDMGNNNITNVNEIQASTNYSYMLFGNRGLTIAAWPQVYGTKSLFTFTYDTAGNAAIQTYLPTSPNNYWSCFVDTNNGYHIANVYNQVTVKMLMMDASNHLISTEGQNLTLNGGNIQNVAGITLGSGTVTNVAEPTSSQDVATKNYVDTKITVDLPISGGTMTGDIDMGSHSIVNASDPTNNQDLATKLYVDTVAAGGGLPVTGGTMMGDINMNSHYITNAKNPVDLQDVATKDYVDSGDIRSFTVQAPDGAITSNTTVKVLDFIADYKPTRTGYIWIIDGASFYVHSKSSTFAGVRVGFYVGGDSQRYWTGQLSNNQNNEVVRAQNVDTMWPKMDYNDPYSTVYIMCDSSTDTVSFSHFVIHMTEMKV